MIRLYPKSFLRLILIGFLLVTLPLVVAIADTVLTIQRLARQSQEAVSIATSAASSSHEMVEILTAMERALRQYLILRNAALLGDYRQLHEELATAMGHYRALPLDAEQRARLSALADRELGVLLAVRSSRPTQGNLDDLVDISMQLRSLIDKGEELVNKKVARVPEAAEEAREHLLWLLGAAVPVAFLIGLWFKRAIADQIGQVDRAIRAIGQAEYNESIEVTGTPDLAYLGQRLEWLRLRLAELEAQKSRFLRHVSHDLKTPLTAVREGAQLLADGVLGVLTEQQKGIVAIIGQNSLRLQKLIEELIDYQQASFAANAIDPRRVPFDRVCQKVLLAHRLAAAARGIRFLRELAPLRLEGDAGKLRTVVDNLLSNALKFSPVNGNITVRLHLNETADQAVLDVIDEGPGVAESEREQIFDAFFRGSGATHGGIKGNGLGLAIAREYVLAHHGTIAVLSRPDRAGAHFRVALPLTWKGAHP